MNQGRRICCKGAHGGQLDRYLTPPITCFWVDGRQVWPWDRKDSPWLLQGRWSAPGFCAAGAGIFTRNYAEIIGIIMRFCGREKISFFPGNKHFLPGEIFLAGLWNRKTNTNLFDLSDLSNLSNPSWITKRTKNRKNSIIP